ncbi:hypothetical protein LXL04_004916 [Taraxacum kok-saghyz]
MHDLELHLQDVDTKIRRTEATLNEQRRLQNLVAKKTAERSTLVQEQEQRYSDLAEENEDPIEGLMEWNGKFRERIADLEDKIETLERDKTNIEAKSSRCQPQINEYIKNVGKLQAEYDNYTSLKKERDSTVQELYRQHNLGSLPKTPFSNEVASNHIAA